MTDSETLDWLDANRFAIDIRSNDKEGFQFSVPTGENKDGHTTYTIVTGEKIREVVASAREGIDPDYEVDIPDRPEPEPEPAEKKYCLLDVGGELFKAYPVHTKTELKSPEAPVDEETVDSPMKVGQWVRIAAWPWPGYESFITKFRRCPFSDPEYEVEGIRRWFSGGVLTPIPTPEVTPKMLPVPPRPEPSPPDVAYRRIPAPGQHVMVLNGAYRGVRGIVGRLEIDGKSNPFAPLILVRSESSGYWVGIDDVAPVGENPKFVLVPVS